MLCILEKVVNNWKEINYFAMDISKLVLPKELEKPTIRFVEIAKEYGLLYPTVNIKRNKVILKYDYDTRYVIFIIKNNQIDYRFGLINGTPKDGQLEDYMIQLRAFSDFIYGSK